MFALIIAPLLENVTPLGALNRSNTVLRQFLSVILVYSDNFLPVILVYSDNFFLLFFQTRTIPFLNNFSSNHDTWGRVHQTMTPGEGSIDPYLLTLSSPTMDETIRGINSACCVPNTVNRSIFASTLYKTNSHSNIFTSPCMSKQTVIQTSLLPLYKTNKQWFKHICFPLYKTSKQWFKHICFPLYKTNKQSFKHLCFPLYKTNKQSFKHFCSPCMRQTNSHSNIFASPCIKQTNSHSNIFAPPCMKQTNSHSNNFASPCMKRSDSNISDSTMYKTNKQSFNHFWYHAI